MNILSAVLTTHVNVCGFIEIPSLIKDIALHKTDVNRRIKISHCTKQMLTDGWMNGQPQNIMPLPYIIARGIKI